MKKLAVRMLNQKQILCAAFAEAQQPAGGQWDNFQGMPVQEQLPEALTMPLRDGRGSTCCVFPCDERHRTYGRPAVTREGQCGMDMARIEREIGTLPAL